MNQHVSRRNVVTASAAAAAAAIPFEEGQASQPVEDPASKVRRLARELALAMDDWIDDMGTSDSYVAHIYPSKSGHVSGFQSFYDLGEGWECIPLPHPADTLSFMRRRKPRGSGIDYWTVAPSGKYSEDWDKGRQLGDEYLKFIGNHPTNGNATLLGCIVRDMAAQREGDKVSGLELGFLSEVNKYAMATARVLIDTMGPQRFDLGAGSTAHAV